MITRGFHDLLRSLAQESHFALCVASRRPLTEVFPSDTTPRGVSPLHNIFNNKTLGPFDETEARDFLTERLAPTGVIFDEDEMEQLMRVSGGHPAELQRRAREWFEERFG